MEQVKSNVGGSGSDTGLSDLAYDWLTIIQKKATAVRAYDKYLQDAQNSPGCVELIQRMRDADRQFIEEGKKHLIAVLTGQEKMPGTGADKGQAQSAGTDKGKTPAANYPAGSGTGQSAGADKGKSGNVGMRH
jgi:hypothetical protein